MKRTIDWETIKTEYITGECSLRALSKKHKVSRTEICRKSSNEGWVNDRKKFKADTVANAVQKLSRTREEEIVASIELADLIDACVREILADPQRLEMLMSTRQPCRELESLSKAITANDDLRRMCRGIMNPRDEERSKLEREKFAYEKQKTERDENEDKKIEVVLSGDIERWAE